jgi:putative glutamine amidotransferase
VGRRTTIGVTGPDKGGLMAWLMTALAVKRCGGNAIRITPARPGDESSLDGVIIGGGTDVDPFHYGEESQQDCADNPDPRNTLLDWAVGLLLGLFRAVFATRSIQGYDPERDQMETHMIQYALYNGLPVLGICRGAQLMNVVLGGSLHQQIEHFYTEETNNVRSVLPRKSITVSARSRLRQILQTGSCVVNALHDQSIKELGDDVGISAVENTGVVQAIERHDLPYFIGVQWHPEYMPQSNTQQNLFRSLVHNASNRDHHAIEPRINRG